MLARLVLNSWPQVICLPRSLISLSLTQGLPLLPSLECSGAIIPHCSLDLLGSSDFPISVSWVGGTTGTCHHTWVICKVFVERGSHYVGLTGLEPIVWRHPLSLVPQSAGITGVSHRARPTFHILRFLHLRTCVRWDVLIIFHSTLCFLC